MRTSDTKKPTSAAGSVAQTGLKENPQKEAKSIPKTSAKTAIKADIDTGVPAKSTAPKVEATATTSLTTPSAAAPAVVDKAQTVVMGPLMRKKELIDRVVTRSGIKKKDAKPVVEAVLAELGQALAEKRELALQPMGKVKIKRERILPNGRMLVARIRQPNPGNATPEKPSDPDTTQ